MGRKKNLLLFTTSFIGGLAAGLLLAPNQGTKNRAWLSKDASEIGRWAKLQKRIARLKGNRELSKIQQNVHQGLRYHIPDLYEATDNISLSENDFIDE